MKNSIVRVSNLIKFIYEKKKKFNPSRGGKKIMLEKKWIVVDKIEYYLVKILENPSNYCGIQVGTEWSIENGQ